MSIEQIKFKEFEDELLSPLRGHALTETEEFVASLLLTVSIKRPMIGKEISEAVQKQFEIKLSQRAVMDAIRSLRKEHAFPILARRSKPPGYWWCGSIKEMEEYIQYVRRHTLDEMHTVSRIVRHNYPSLAGQLNFDFSQVEKPVKKGRKSNANSPQIQQQS